MEKKKTILLSAAIVMVAVGGFWMFGSLKQKAQWALQQKT